MKNIQQDKASRRRKQPHAEVEKNRPGNGHSYQIGPATRFDFEGQNLTPYGGLLPVATMLDNLGLEELVGQYVKVKRIPRAIS